ncbi:arginine utilization regulatory protein [Desulfocicer vacuolatum DSM 3385]|uniref:Arginine utilization regulatory protein n=1 Tax=Desulfocicer vacuolatum DSM 3385 TaxID=1121400 RepID=A0A1W2AWA8_9BACT|nr:sigma 54-interacting transcriptional regulator [Desulfocicer vacuolatum]SMC64731.1 arginine utilization regulatory protein [Desulfocicer vacuolatum DSM 3385]
MAATTPFFIEKALEFTGMDFLTTLSQLDEGVLIVDVNGTIIFYNRLHGIIDGISPQQVLGKKITEVYNLSSEESLTLRCLKNGRPILQEYIIYKPRKGVVVNSINSVYPIKKNEKIVACISFLKDYKILKTLISPEETASQQNAVKKTRHYTFNHIKGAAQKLLMAVTTAKKSSNSPSPIMLYGETGTGKEMFAQSIHHSSHRSDNPYVAINCASIPDNLFESILFGTRKGSFTGAMDQKGLFEQASGGTLFLDEIDSMPPALQTKMLRALQEKKIRRVGDLEEIPVNIKVISSTSTSPRHFLKNESQFRKDLFYRLAVVLIEIPPLRKREQDISRLTQHFLKNFNSSMKRRVHSVSREVMALFYNYNWPGNVRELEHVIEGAMNIVENDSIIDIYHIAPYFKNMCPLFLASQRQPTPVSLSCAEKKEGNGEPNISLEDTKSPENNNNEKKMMEQLLMECNGKVTVAAKKMGISRQLFHYRMKKHGLVRQTIVKQCEKQALEQALDACRGNLTQTAKKLGISLQLLNYKMKNFL